MITRMMIENLFVLENGLTADVVEVVMVRSVVDIVMRNYVKKSLVAIIAIFIIMEVQMNQVQDPMRKIGGDMRLMMVRKSLRRIKRHD
jgi:hypothetical protein